MLKMFKLITQFNRLLSINFTFRSPSAKYITYNKFNTQSVNLAKSNMAPKKGSSKRKVKYIYR